MNDIYGIEDTNEEVEVIKEDKKEQQNDIENKLKDVINEGEEDSIENNKINDQNKSQTNNSTPFYLRKRRRKY
jgi:hypothetical protein